MHAREHTCRVIENVWLTPTVFRFRFEALKRFTFEPGQFVSVMVPRQSKTIPAVKRCYSLSSSPEEGMQAGFYELCVKHVPGGRGTDYLASLQRGDLFRVYAPYGHFTFKAPERNDRRVVFVATGSGLAPFRSMALSGVFQHSVRQATCLLGVRTADEIFFRTDFERAGVKFVSAVSQSAAPTGHFPGRVTDYLKRLPAGYPFHLTDFYLCGNGEMVAEVNRLLRGSFGVPETSIHKEAFSLTVNRVSVPQPQKAGEKRLISLGVPSLERAG